MTLKPRRIDYNPDNFIAGVAGQMSADQLGVYWLICTLIYSHGGPIDYDEKRFAALLPGTHWRSIRAASERLQELGKITVSDGQVMAKGCAEPLQAAFMRVSKAVDNGLKGGRPPKENNEMEEPEAFSEEKLTGVTPLPPSPSCPPSSSLHSDKQRTPVASRSKPKCALPDNFPEKLDLEWAQERWLQKGRADLCSSMGDEVQKFRDHHISHASKSADWSASWRTWAQNAMKFNRVENNGHAVSNAKSAGQPSFVAGAAAAINRMRAS